MIMEMNRRLLGANWVTHSALIGRWVGLYIKLLSLPYTHPFTYFGFLIIVVGINQIYILGKRDRSPIDNEAKEFTRFF